MSEVEESGTMRTGRPRGFDRHEAVATAMRLFWQYGYEGTSLDQLRRAIGHGLSSASFYAAFKSKEALYREALAFYLTTHGQVVAALHDGSLSPRTRIERALRGSAEMQTSAGHPSGCFVTLSATIGSPALASIGDLASGERSFNRAAILACVREAVAKGTLQPETDAAGLATLFEGLLVGLSIQARDGIDGTTINAAVSQAMHAWDANSLPDTLSDTSYRALG